MSTAGGQAGGQVGVLVMAHGTPDSPEEIEAFYTRIRRGRPPTPELLEELTDRYESIGGTSPLTGRTRAQVDGLAAALEAAEPGRFVVRLGTKYVQPTIEEGTATVWTGSSASCSPHISRPWGPASTSAGPSPPPPPRNRRSGSP